jgi:hypothetical protein
MATEPHRLTAPQPIERLELVRILAPLAILGFLVSRFVHVEHWLTDIGFVVPPQPFRDYRQPLYIPPIPVWLATFIALSTVGSGIATSLGWRTRPASGMFAALLTYLALADRLEAFTVNKLGAIVAIAIFATPSGARYGLEARSRDTDDRPELVSWGNVRFFQALLMFMYFGSGIAKLRGGWLSDPHVIWSHLHDSYQTSLTYFLARNVPSLGWTLFQYLTLAYEVGAPLWFSLKKTRVPALFVGLGMHAMIGLMFGPVVWFSLLMSALLLGSFAPLPWLKLALTRVWHRTKDVTTTPKPETAHP